MGIIGDPASSPSDVESIFSRHTPSSGATTLATVGSIGEALPGIPDPTQATTTNRYDTQSQSDVNSLFDPQLKFNIAGLAPASSPAATSTSSFSGFIPTPENNSSPEQFLDNPIASTSSGFADSGSWAPGGLSISNGDPGSVSGLFSNISTNVSGTISQFTNAGLQDLRVRLSALNPQAVYGSQSTNNILSPLYVTGGMLFPYTPNISFSQDVDYTNIEPIQNNTYYLAYTRTPAVTLNISGKFSVQNASEGQYALACLHFLRVASKSYFGKSAGVNAGLPPPILVLNGYGTYMYNNLRVILRNHSWQFEEGMDTVAVSAGGGVTKLPALFTVTLTVVVQQTPAAWRDRFDIESFRTGALMRQGGWI